MKKVIKKCFAVLSLLLAIQVSQVEAIGLNDVTFSMLDPIRVDEVDPTVNVPQITFRVDKEVEVKRAVLTIPRVIPLIIYSDFSKVSITGNASSKVSEVSIEDLSSDQRDLNFEFESPLQKDDEIVISGLVLKAYDFDSPATQIELKIYDENNEVAIIKSDRYVRYLDITDERRRSIAPEPIRQFNVDQLSGSEVQFSWNSSPDIDFRAYQVKLYADINKSRILYDKYISNNTTSFLFDNQEANTEWYLEVTVISEAQLMTTSGQLVNFNTQEQTDGEQADLEQDEEMIKTKIQTEVLEDIRLKFSTGSDFFKQKTFAEQLTASETIALIKESSVWKKFSVRTQLVLDFYQTKRANSIENFSNEDFMRLIDLISRSQGYPVLDIHVERPNLLPLTFRERLYSRQVWYLQKKGVVISEYKSLLFSDLSEVVTFEKLLVLLEGLESLK